jgi:hypothetical protein
MVRAEMRRIGKRGGFGAANPERAVSYQRMVARQELESSGEGETIQFPVASDMSREAP